MSNSDIIAFVRSIFKEPEGFIPLHAPLFGGNEKKYVSDTIESTFVSSVGKYVNRFEEMMQEITGARYAVATVNGTTALHLAMIVGGVKDGDEVITQPLTFVATANAISHCRALPVFVDVDRETMGLSPDALSSFLKDYAVVRGNECYNKQTGRRISVCIPMHTFGFPAFIEEIAEVCAEWKIALIEDAAESIGSYVGNQHTGTFGLAGTFSFNGNKTITSGGGGAIVTNDEGYARLAKHLSTTAKQPHTWEFVHDHVAFNYRMPNLNAALACAQLEQLPVFLERKRALSSEYAGFFQDSGISFITERKGTTANYWLNAILFADRPARDSFLSESNTEKVMSRPAWELMNRLPMYRNCLKGDLSNAEWLEERLVNIPSSVRNQ
ncbi:LegC family aminotransferase [Arcticibacter sp. MXS-1]|uniref:LegC family aminotransferase n=1 Tax=Arcticibacter sp. MXS-1 TaxID=3341726 RepID=UPI0035A94CDC